MNRPNVKREKIPPRTATTTPSTPPATSTPTLASVCGVMCSSSSTLVGSNEVPKVLLSHVVTEARASGMAWISVTACETSRFPNAAEKPIAKTTTPSMTSPVASPRRMCWASRLTAGSMAMLARKAMTTWKISEPPSWRMNDPNE